MQHVYDLSTLHPERPALLTIGVFDGVHRGHQHLIAHLVSEAHAHHQQAVVLTLFPHPDLMLRGLRGRYYLTSPERKADLLGAIGVDLVITYPFNEAVQHMRAASFVDELLAHLKLAGLWITADFALGYEREGDFAFLESQGVQKGFAVRAIDLLQNGADGYVVISSSTIRAALVAGEVDQATALLGRPYSMTGTVVHGDHRGRTIGFPTANVETWDEQVIPANGVYACFATIEATGERFKAVTNVGQRPTFDGIDTRIEAHLLDFDRDVYGARLTVEFVARLRGEQKFAGIDALVAQIRADAEAGRGLLDNYKAGDHAGFAPTQTLP